MIMLISLHLLLIHPFILVHGCQGEIGNLICTGSNQGGKLYINATIYPPRTSSKTNFTYYEYIFNKSYANEYSSGRTIYDNLTEVTNLDGVGFVMIKPSTFYVTVTLLGFINYTEDNGTSWIVQQCLEERIPSSTDMQWQFNVTNDNCNQQVIPTTPSPTSPTPSNPTTSHANRIFRNSYFSNCLLI